MNNVKKLREAKGITKYKLCKDTPLTMNSLIAIEAGGDVKLSTLIKIAKALKVSPKELIE